nr:MAG TPA: hypothetical protein [Caudoviricetes sp.]DAZ53956.1 MAG TPA: hypothetical protein [Caudoviricetes sp.]
MLSEKRVGYCSKRIISSYRKKKYLYFRTKRYGNKYWLGTKCQ